MPKAGSSAAEYEDAVASSRRGLRYAVADGASASAFARLWAHLLVHAYTGGFLGAETLEGDLAPFQTRWAELVGRRRLPWYAEEQARRGAFAALLGLSLSMDQRWSALAVGDCCLFQVRDDVLVAATPLDDPADFKLRPLLLGSRPAANIDLRSAGAVVMSDGTWRPGDSFLLMSDALAAMFLTRVRACNGAPLAALDFDGTAAGFRTWIRRMRSEGCLRNDDVSLLWLNIDADHGATA
jgi:hypothetical protein